MTKQYHYSPIIAKFHNHKGAAYSNENKPQEAIKYYSQAIEIDFSYALAYSNRRLDYEKLNEIPKARQDLQKAAAVYKQQGYIKNSEKTLKRLKAISN